MESLQLTEGEVVNSEIAGEDEDEEVRISHPSLSLVLSVADPL